MKWAHLDDGRAVVVDSSREQTRQVGGKTFFLAPAYVNVLLEGRWQTVRRSRLKDAEYGHPYQAYLSEYRGVDAK